MAGETIKERELLKKLRGHLAYRQKSHPYIIFGDKELELLLEQRPKTISELGTIKGFPADGKRVAGYGQAIISIFVNADKVEDFEVKVDDKGDIKVLTRLKSMSAF